MKRITLDHVRLIPSFLRYRLLLVKRQRNLPQSPIVFSTDGDVDLHMQFGVNRGLDAVIALEAALKFLPVTFTVYLHPDDRVSPSEVETVRRMLTGVTVCADESRAIVMEQLQRRKLDNLIRFRQAHHLAKKLVDALIVGENKTLLVLDDDCLAFSYASELSEIKGNFCLRDPSDENYSRSNDELRATGNARLFPRLNSGFIRYYKMTDDLSYLDYVIGQYQLPMNHFTEQTLWAFLLSRSELTVLDPGNYQVGATAIHPKTRVVHYVGHYLGDAKLEMRSVGQARAVAAARSYARS